MKTLPVISMLFWSMLATGLGFPISIVPIANRLIETNNNNQNRNNNEFLSTGTRQVQDDVIDGRGSASFFTDTLPSSLLSMLMGRTAIADHDITEAELSFPYENNIMEFPEFPQNYFSKTEEEQEILLSKSRSLLALGTLLVALSLGGILGVVLMAFCPRLCHCSGSSTKIVLVIINKGKGDGDEENGKKLPLVITEPQNVLITASPLNSKAPSKTKTTVEIFVKETVVLKKDENENDTIVFRI